MSELYDILVETPPTKVILLALDQGLWDCERSLAELAALCEANHMEAVAEVTQKRQTPETGIVLGSGKLEEAAAAAGELGAECAVFDGELTGSQIRNISTALGGMEVIDRTMLILEIFRSRAVTNEGKLQTELALLRYRLPRLQGMGESLSRQGGGGGGGKGSAAAEKGTAETAASAAVQQQKQQELEQIIAEEKLKPAEAQRFVANAFRDGAFKTTGTDIDQILPPVSRFGGGNRTEKKKTIIQRLAQFFEKYFGI